MKTLKFNKNSFHFKLAEFAGISTYHDNNICSYVKCVIGGVLLMLLLIVMGSLVGFVLMTTIMQLCISYMYSTNIINDVGYVGIGLVITTILMSILFYFRDTPSHKCDNFIYNAYKSHKEKFCVKIDFVE